MMRRLSPEEAVKRLEDDPSSLFITLADFLKGLTPTELHGELLAGRLVANSTKQTLANAKSGKGAAASEFSVSMQATIDWMTNPQTPVHLVAKFQVGIGRKLH